MEMWLNFNKTRKEGAFKVFKRDKTCWWLSCASRNGIAKNINNLLWTGIFIVYEYI